jgi:hypothetical protein
VGKPNEIDFIQLQESTYQQQKYIFQQEKFTYSTQQSHRNLPRKACPEIRTVVRPAPNQPSKTEPKMLLYSLLCMAVLQQQTLTSYLNFHASLASKTMPTSLLYRLYGFVQYSLQHSNIFQQLLHRKLPWEMCPISLGKSAQLLPSLSFLKLSHKSLSKVSCTLP